MVNIQTPSRFLLQFKINLLVLFCIFSCANASQYSCPETAGGGLWADIRLVEGENIETMSCPVEFLSGYIEVTDNTALTAVEFSKLTRIGDYLEIQTNKHIKTLNFQALDTIEGYINIKYNKMLETINFQALTLIGGYLKIGTNDALTSIAYPALIKLNHYFEVTYNNQLTTLSFPKLDEIKGHFIVSNNEELATVKYKQLGKIGSYLHISNNKKFTTLSFCKLYARPTIVSFTKNPILNSLGLCGEMESDMLNSITQSAQSSNPSLVNIGCNEAQQAICDVTIPPTTMAPPTMAPTPPTMAPPTMAPTPPTMAPTPPTTMAPSTTTGTTMAPTPPTMPPPTTTMALPTTTEGLSSMDMDDEWPSMDMPMNGTMNETDAGPTFFVDESEFGGLLEVFTFFAFVAASLSIYPAWLVWKQYKRNQAKKATQAKAVILKKSPRSEGSVEKNDQSTKIWVQAK